MGEEEKPPHKGRRIISTLYLHNLLQRLGKPFMGLLVFFSHSYGFHDTVFISHSTLYRFHHTVLLSNVITYNYGMYSLSSHIFFLSSVFSKIKVNTQGGLFSSFFYSPSLAITNFIVFRVSWGQSLMLAS